MDGAASSMNMDDACMRLLTAAPRSFALRLAASFCASCLLPARASPLILLPTGVRRFCFTWGGASVSRYSTPQCQLHALPARAAPACSPMPPRARLRLDMAAHSTALPARCGAPLLRGCAGVALMPLLVQGEGRNPVGGLTP